MAMRVQCGVSDWQGLAMNEGKAPMPQRNNDLGFEKGEKMAGTWNYSHAVAWSVVLSVSWAASRIADCRCVGLVLGDDKLSRACNGSNV